jgi:hypothetical protein
VLVLGSPHKTEKRNAFVRGAEEEERDGMGHSRWWRLSVLTETKIPAMRMT